MYYFTQAGVNFLEEEGPVKYSEKEARNTLMLNRRGKWRSEERARKVAERYTKLFGHKTPYTPGKTFSGGK